MEASLFSLFYLAFRLMPFILICYYVVSYVFLQQVDALIFLGGLLLTCLLAFLAGSISFFRDSAMKSNNTICSTIGLAKDKMLSVLPMSTVVYAYALSYLGIPILHYNRNQSNLPILILFPILLFLDILWLYFFGCSSPTNIFAAGVVGMTGGLAYSEIIFQSAYKNQQYNSILTDTAECNMSTSSGFHCVQRTQQEADKLGDAKDMEANLLLNTYKYLGGLVSSGSDELKGVLKQGSAYGSGAVSFMQKTAGTLSTSAKPASNGYMAYPFTLMKGNQIGRTSYQVPSTTVCQSACDADDTCAAFVYDSKEQTCTIHKAIGSQFSVNAGKTTSGATTYYKSPPGFLTVPSTTVPADFVPLNKGSNPTARPGQTTVPNRTQTTVPTNGQKVGSPLECAKLCLDKKGCFGYTFGTQTGMCSLYGKEVNSSLLFAPSTTTDLALLNVIVETETKYKDIAYQSLDPVQSVQECMKACYSNPTCSGFSYNTFDRNNQVCDLKPRMTTSEPNVNFTSYTMPKTFYNTYVNTVYGSSTAASGNVWKTSDPKKMAFDCNADSSCLGFMHNGSQFIRIDSSNLLPTPTSATGTTTYFKQGTDPLAMQNFVPIPQTSLEGGDVDKDAEYTDTTPPSCASLCQANSQCIGFVYDKSTTNCTLKKVLTGQGTQINKGDPNATTYFSQPPGYTASLNKMVPSIPSDDTLTGATPKSCADACSARQSCTGFAYLHGMNQCYLKQGDLSSPTTDKNFILYKRNGS